MAESAAAMHARTAQEHILIREDDVIGVMPRANATAADIPELRPCGDRVLVKVGGRREEAPPARGAGKGRAGEEGGSLGRGRRMKQGGAACSGCAGPLQPGGHHPAGWLLGPGSHPRRSAALAPGSAVR